MSVAFSTTFANYLLQNLTYDVNSWTAAADSRGPLYASGTVYLALLSGTGYDFSAKAVSASDVVAYTSSALWTPAVDGVKRGTYTFSGVAHAGVPAEAFFAYLSGGTTLYPCAVGEVTISGGGGMVIGSVASYSSGNRDYVTNLYIPPDNGGTIRLGTSLRNALADKMVNGGADIGMFDGSTLSFYDGTQPATADTAVTTQTLLAIASTTSAPWGVASARSVSNASTITISTAVASGTATWARLVHGIYTMDFGVGALTGDIIIPSAFSAGSTKTLSIGAITLSFP